MIVLGLALAGVSAGCTRYEYDVQQPRVVRLGQESALLTRVAGPGEAGEVARAREKEELVVGFEPMRYRFTVVENRLVMQAFNPTSEVVQLVGVRSVVTDPTGQARPVRSQPIPPGAFVKFVLPPVRPEFVGRGGPVTVGMRGGYGPGMGRGDFGYGGTYDEPTSYSLRDGGEIYWDWKGVTGEARVTLVFERGGKEFTHEFVFGRREAE